MNGAASKTPIIFAAFAESPGQLQLVYFMAESIREFGGQMKNAPIRLYVADYKNIDIDEVAAKFKPLNVEVLSSSAPGEALWINYTGKVYAAGLAEKEAAGQAEILVWLDCDTIIFQEPTELLLPQSVGFAYCPVTHNRSGSLYDEAPDPFWKRIYDVLQIKNEDLFPVITPADRQKVRAYFNAGLLPVRPERGILRKWSDDFKTLYMDSVMADMCRENVTHMIFLHQAALVGAVLNTLKRDEIIELSEKYNYPLFFDRMYEAVRQFDTIEDVVTMRYGAYFYKPDTEWESLLTGPPEKIAWLKERFGE